VPFLLDRGAASFLVKIANVANPANVANAVFRQVAAFPAPPCFSRLLYLLPILLL
jgi:hypothetical protein